VLFTFIYEWFRRAFKGISLIDNGINGAVIGVILGALYLMNSWDVFTGLIIMGILSLVIIVSKVKQKISPKELLLPLIVFWGVSSLFAGSQFLLSRFSYLPAVSGVGINTTFSKLSDIVLLFMHFNWDSNNYFKFL